MKRYLKCLNADNAIDLTTNKVYLWDYGYEFVDYYKILDDVNEWSIHLKDRFVDVRILKIKSLL